MVNILKTHSIYRMDRIAVLNLKKNRLRDVGLIELSKGIRFARNLVSLDISSNEITPKGIQALTQAASMSISLTSLNLSTVDGVQRNRVAQEGGRFIAENMLANKDCLLQEMIMNNTSLRDNGLHHILNVIGNGIKENSDEIE